MSEIPNDSQKIGVIGSPNSLDLFYMDVLNSSIDDSLYGKLLKFTHIEKREDLNLEMKVFCQVTSMENKNVWHEQLGMRSLVKMKGQLSNLSGDADLKLCHLSYLGAYKNKIEGFGWDTDNIGTPPRSGIYVSPIQQLDIDMACDLSGLEKWYMGRVPGTRLNVPFSIRHFGPFKEGGYGEARMVGVFGQSGSGKSIVAAELLAGYAKHKQMGILIIDPQGEFHDDKFGEGTPFKFEFLSLIEKSGKSILKCSIDNLQLESDTTLFVNMLLSRGILRDLGYSAEEKQEMLATIIQDRLNKSKRIDLQFSEMCLLAHTSSDRIYSGSSVMNVKNKVEGAQNSSALKNKFDSILKLFELKNNQGKNKIRLENLIQAFLEGKMVILSLVDYSSQMTIEDKSLLVNEIAKKIIEEASSKFKSGGRKLNGMIVLDEAHRYASQKSDGEDLPKIMIELRKQLEMATRETRKYGLGWLFVTQSLVGFSKTIYRQLTDLWFGFGLTIGYDAELVIDRVGKEAYDMYAHFPNPKQTGKYLFLAYGSSISIGTMGRPIVIEGFSQFEEFVKLNYSI